MAAGVARSRFALALLLLLEPQWAQEPAKVAPAEAENRPVEVLQFGIEWRLVRAGVAKLSRSPRASAGWEANVQLESAGLVSKLFRVKDDYRVMYDSAFCASGTTMAAEEGSRRRQTTVTFDRDARKSHYLERDLVKNAVVLEKTIEIPSCVHDVVAALVRLRAMKLPLGQSTQLPLSDGKKSVSAKVEAQEKETVRTPSGTYETIRYEAYLFNEVLYQRTGRLYFWLTDDDRRIPVQVRARLSFPVGTISLQLEKIGS